MKISIIGASGGVGAATAFTIAHEGLAEELVLTGHCHRDRLDQYIADLQTAVIDRNLTFRAGTVQDINGSGIVIIAAGTADMSAGLDTVYAANVPIIRSVCDAVTRSCPDAVVITATNPVCTLNYAVHRLTGLERGRCLGYSANDSYRFRLYLAQALGIESYRIQAMVLGEHGKSQVPLFSSVRVDDEPFTVTEVTRNVVRQAAADSHPVLENQRKKTGRTAAWTTSVGLAETCRAIVRDTGEIIPTSCALEGEYGYTGLGMTVPAVIGREGVRDIMELDLEPEERKKLDESAEVLRESLKLLNRYLETG